MFPFIQCHHTSGRALCGGFTKPLFSESPELWAGAAEVCANAGRPNKVSTMMPAVIGILPILTERRVVFVILICNFLFSTLLPLLL
jgi:hypothetical protein